MFLKLNIRIFKGEDFHQFACGSFVKFKRIPDEQSKIDAFDMLSNNLALSVAGV